jgi:hypothetical protein
MVEQAYQMQQCKKKEVDSTRAVQDTNGSSNSMIRVRAVAAEAD